MTNDKKIIIQSVDLLKRKLIAQYIYLMSFVLFAYACVFYFLVKDTFFAFCTFSYGVVLLYTFLIIRNNYNIKTLVHLYLTYAPLFGAFIMLNFWKYSAASCMWLLPVPLGAHIFLEKKYVYIYSFYILAILTVVSFLAKVLDFNYFTLSDVNYIIISDTFVFVVNIFVIFLLLYYNEKIRRVEIGESFINNMKLSENTNLSVNNTYNGQTDHTLNEQNTDKYIRLFDEIKSIVEEEYNFKEVDFTISRLSDTLKTNNLYIAKAIKMNGYSNFNHYINTCRVKHVKKLIQENDINKITLMYVYTASGFSNQSTFNRVFKQIEGITPSEYINQISEVK